MEQNTGIRFLFAAGLGLLVAAFLLPADAAAERKANTPAGQAVMTTVADVRRTVEEQNGKSTPEQLDEKLKAIIYPVFDFNEMSRRSLGANWKEAAPEQQNEFVKLFSDLLARNYLKKIRENVAKSEVLLVSDSQTDDSALVRTTVNSERQSAAIDYRLRQKDGKWRIYDVVIENIGLVSNYRSEFAGIVRKEGFDGLLKKLREKQVVEKVPGGKQ